MLWLARKFSLLAELLDLAETQGACDRHEVVACDDLQQEPNRFDCHAWELEGSGKPRVRHFCRRQTRGVTQRRRPFRPAEKGAKTDVRKGPPTKHRMFLSLRFSLLDEPCQLFGLGHCSLPSVAWSRIGEYTGDLVRNDSR